MELTAKQLVIDFVFIFLCLRIVYSALKQGLISEVVKMGGLFFGALFAFHFYVCLAALIADRIRLFSLEIFAVLSFVFLLGVGVGTFALVRAIAMALQQKKETTLKERWLLVLLGVIRATFLISVIGFVVQLIPLDFQAFNQSCSGSVFKKIAPKIYLVSFNVCKFIYPQVTVNKEVQRYYSAMLKK